MRRRDRSSDIKRLAIGSGIAALAGYIAGVLSAPKSGQKNRKDLKKAANKQRAEAEKELKALHSELDKVIKDAKASSGKVSSKAAKEAKTIVEKASDTKEKVREIISAIHEGDASDQDLKRAVKNASSAIDHLRDYLKK